MNENDFKKGIGGLKKIRMEKSEKNLILTRILATPIKSPYAHKTAYLVFAFCLLLIITSVDIVRVSGNALPGDKLYGVKTRVVEPVLDIVNSTPEEKLVWEEEKINRRIVEAEALIEKDDLDEKKLEDLERKIEKSSRSFVRNVEIVASSTSVSTTSAKEKSNDLKLKLRQKINNEKDEREESFSSKRRNNQREQIKRLKDRAIRVLDDERDEDRGDE